MKIVVFESVTLDGVMQAPGRQDEDLRGGFSHGGWATPYSDEVLGKVAGEGMAKSGALLFGRRTYEDFHGFWPNQSGDNPFTAVLNDTQKYVASRTLQEPLPWSHSTLLAGDAAESVARLKKDPGRRRGSAGERRTRPDLDAFTPGRRVGPPDPPVGSGIRNPAIP